MSPRRGNSNLIRAEALSAARALRIAGAVSLLLAMVAWGCTGTDDRGSQPAAAQQAAEPSFQVSSPVFHEKGYPSARIPKKYSCYGESASPPLDWTEAPAGTRSLALVAEDVDHQTGVWVLWVLYDIPPDVVGLPEGISTSTEVLPDGTTQGTNDDKNIGYNGPCPPLNITAYRFRPAGAVGDPPHRYYFRLYALDTTLGLGPGVTKAELVSAMEGHILAEAETMGKLTTPRIIAEP